jgi:hypothetical protein
MSTKLTLTVEQSIIERAKIYAKNTGRSLSDLISSYLDSLTKNQPEDLKSGNAKINQLFGSVQLPDDFDEDAERYSQLAKKHMR